MKGISILAPEFWGMNAALNTLLKPRLRISHTTWTATAPKDFNDWMKQVHLERLRTQYRLLEYDYAAAANPKRKQEIAFQMGTIAVNIDFQAQRKP